MFAKFQHEQKSILSVINKATEEALSREEAFVTKNGSPNIDRRILFLIQGNREIMMLVTERLTTQTTVFQEHLGIPALFLIGCTFLCCVKLVD